RSSGPDRPASPRGADPSVARPGTRNPALAPQARVSEASPMRTPTTSPRALSADDVREVIGAPHELVVLKVRPSLDDHCRAFIARSPFLALGTVDASGNADVSPRGDPPGFVKVLDDGTLAIPERPGNKLMDSLANILETGTVGLLFVIPGI